MKELIEELKELNARVEEIKEQLKNEYLTEEGYKDKNVTISWIKPSESTSIDLKKLESKEPELYEDLLKDYEKVTKRAGSYRYTFK